MWKLFKCELRLSDRISSGVWAMAWLTWAKACSHNEYILGFSQLFYFSPLFFLCFKFLKKLYDHLLFTPSHIHQRIPPPPSTPNPITVSINMPKLQMHPWSQIYEPFPKTQNTENYISQLKCGFVAVLWQPCVTNIPKDHPDSLGSSLERTDLEFGEPLLSLFLIQRNRNEWEALHSWKPICQALTCVGVWQPSLSLKVNKSEM